jgi:hypothetical protein
MILLSNVCMWSHKCILWGSCTVINAKYMSTYKFVIKGTLAMMVVTQEILTIYVYLFLFFKKGTLCL